LDNLVFSGTVLAYCRPAVHLPIKIDDFLHGQTVEWERLEFKQGCHPEAVLHTMCAFTNDFHKSGWRLHFHGRGRESGTVLIAAARVTHQQTGRHSKRDCRNRATSLTLPMPLDTSYRRLMIDTPPVLFGRYSDLGIYTLADVVGHENSRGHSMAIKFALFEPFVNPVSLRNIRQCIGHGTTVQGLTPIPRDAFQQILSRSV
jgi:hypothetical protein